MSVFVSDRRPESLPREAIDVHPPSEAELRACRLILPEVFADSVPLALIAVADSPRRILGVAALQAAQPIRQRAWRLHLHVVPPYRRHGVGRRLLDAVVSRARPAGVDHLVAAVTDRDEAAGAFLAATGFRHTLRVDRFETGVEAQAQAVAELYERLRQKGRIPPAARVVRLHEAPRQALMDLLSAPAGDVAAGNPGLTNLEWSEAWRHPSISQVSPVVMLDDQPVGVVVAERRGEVATVTWRAVSPGHRLGWANIMLAHVAIEWMQRGGARRMRFDSTTLTTDTQRMTQVFGLPRIAQIDHWALSLTGGAHS